MSCTEEQQLLELPGWAVRQIHPTLKTELYLRGSADSNSEQFPQPSHEMTGRQQSNMYNYYNRDKKRMACHHKILQTAEFG